MILRVLPGCFGERGNTKDMQDYLHKVSYNTNFLHPGDKNTQMMQSVCFNAEQNMKATALTGAYPGICETIVTCVSYGDGNRTFVALKINNHRKQPGFHIKQSGRGCVS